MIPLDRLKKEKLSEYAFILLFFMGFFIPGYGYLHMTNKEFLYSLSATPMVLTSMFYSLPLILVWFIESLLGENEEMKKHEIVGLASIKAIAMFYVTAVSLKLTANITGRIDHLNDFYYFYSFQILGALALIFSTRYFPKKIKRGNKKSLESNHQQSKFKSKK